MRAEGATASTTGNVGGKGSAVATETARNRFESAPKAGTRMPAARIQVFPGCKEPARCHGMSSGVGTVSGLVRFALTAGLAAWREEKRQKCGGRSESDFPMEARLKCVCAGFGWADRCCA